MRETSFETSPPLSLALAKATLAKARRIVIKVGTTLVTNEGKGLDDVAIGQWCQQIGTLLSDTKVQRELIVVSSGSIAEGMKRLGWRKRPSAINELQAAAAVGQMGLAQHYESHLRQNGVQSAQVLLTHADLSDRERYLNARSTLLTLLRHKVLPIINENDTVINDEIKFGDNDTLGALVTNLVEADLLIILTDQKGLYTADPRKNPNTSLIQHTQAGTPELERIAGGAGSALGKGGMLTKVLAAKRAASSGASTVIAWGREDNVLVRLCSGEIIGSLLQAQAAKLQARKRWMVNHLQWVGSVVVDAGAAQRLQSGKASLLPIGITTVKGTFNRGDVIIVCNAQGLEIARGLANYSSAEARKLCRQPSSAFTDLLGYSGEAEMIHRDNLVLSPSPSQSPSSNPNQISKPS